VKWIFKSEKEEGFKREKEGYCILLRSLYRFGISFLTV